MGWTRASPGWWTRDTGAHFSATPLASAIRGGAVDVVFLPSTVSSLLLAAAAALVAVFSLFTALIGAA